MSQLESSLLDTIPFQEHRTEKRFTQQVRRTFLKAGYRPFKAVYDKAGNCVSCGESGRCPGWHIKEGELRAWGC